MFTEKVDTIPGAEMKLVNNNATDIIQSVTEIHNDKLLSFTPKKSKVSFTEIREMETKTSRRKLSNCSIKWKLLNKITMTSRKC